MRGFGTSSRRIGMASKKERRRKTSNIVACLSLLCWSHTLFSDQVPKIVSYISCSAGCTNFARTKINTQNSFSTGCSHFAQTNLPKNVAYLSLLWWSYTASDQNGGTKSCLTLFMLVVGGSINKCMTQLGPTSVYIFSFSNHQNRSPSSLLLYCM
jgi:hypothetical protein